MLRVLRSDAQRAVNCAVVHAVIGERHVCNMCAGEVAREALGTRNERRWGGRWGIGGEAQGSGEVMLERDECETEQPNWCAVCQPAVCQPGTTQHTHQRRAGRARRPGRGSECVLLGEVLDACRGTGGLQQAAAAER